MDWKKYLLAFFITAAIFGTAFYLAARFNSQRIADIQATENQISLDILSSETQYDLLGQLDCSQIAEDPVLSDELNSLANRLSYAEDNLGTTNSQVIALKEQYSLLEIKDYLLMQKVSTQCHVHPVYILYFYSNAGDCPDCSREGDVLTYLRETYPDLRVYAFDYNLDLSALKTLIDIRRIRKDLPALVIDNRAPIYGLKTVSDILSLAPEIQKLATTTPTVASSTAGY
jgi:hypothetical protein